MNTSKIIKAYIRDGTYSTTEPITQGDYGYILQIEGTELPPVYRVDFSNDRHKGEALPVYGNENGVEVPEELIATGKDIFAFYFYIKENFGKTAYTWKIPNDTRAQNGDRVPTPTQQDSIDQLVVRSNEAVERAEQAKTGAETAQGKAEDAQDAAEAAERNARQSATASAQSAEASARCSSDAQESAEEAEQFTHRAEEAQRETASLVEEAQRYVNTAGSAARDAETYANNAYGYARSANESANTASTKAGEASESANIASEKASEAGQSASAASQKATESAQSASQASGYKDTAEQAKNDAQTAKTDAEDARDDAQTAQELAENAESNAESTVHGVLDSLDLETTSGSIVETHDAFPVSPEKMVVDINPVQDLSNGDPSPENICPISGWEGVNVRRCNENLWDDAWYSLGNVMSLITDETSDFYGYYSGSVASWGSAQRSNGLNRLLPNGADDRLYVTADFGNGGSSTFIFRIYFSYADGTRDYNGGNISVSAGGKVRATRVSASGKKCIGFEIETAAGTGNRNGRIKDIQASIGDQRDFVEPVQNPLIPISWQTEAGTVYGGKLDVLSGVMVITHKGVDMGSLSWSMQAGTGTQLTRFNTAGIANDVSREQTQVTYPVMLDLKAPFLVPNSNPVYSRSVDNAMCVLCSNGTFYATCSLYTSAADFKTAVSGMMLVYRLAEPIEIQLTPQQITLFKDYNALWADTGDISEFAYRAGEFATKADIPEVPVEDVQVNGMSVVENKVANIDLSGIEQNAEDIASLEEDIYKPYAVDTASGAIASFPDGADDIPLKSLVVNIDPVQDLHGQESPYPAGGGKNLLKNNLTSQTQNGITVSVDNQGIITLTGTATVQTQFDINTDIGIGAGNYILSGIDGGSATTFKLEAKVDGSWGVNLFNGERSLSIATSIERLVIIVYNGASLSNVQIKPMIRLASVTDATYAPYENICPISGWTQVDVEQSGVNVWDEEWELGGINSATGANTNVVSAIRAKGFTRIKPLTSYYNYFGNTGSGFNFQARFYDADKNYIGYVNANGTGIAKNTAFVTPSNAHYLRFQVQAEYGTTYNHDISINYPSTDHSYHPYTGRSITINLGQTVYGGKLDVLSGVLTVDRATVILDGSNDEVWTLQSINSYGIANFYTYVDHYPAQNYKTFCDIFPTQTSLIGATETEGYFFHHNGSTVYIRIYSHRASTSAEMREWLASNPIHFVFGLAEPITYHLTPTEVRTLLGINNIFADTGDTEATYRADTKLYIEKLTQPTEDDMVANSAIASGQFFMIGNSLYRALANIASGATITVGTNAQRVSLSDALNLVNT